MSHAGNSAPNPKSYVSQMLYVASYMGLIFGGYWAVKYLAVLLIFSPYTSLLSVIYLLLTLPVPFVAAYLTKIYRDRYRTGSDFSFAEAYLFGVLLYFFAALIVALPHYYFYAEVLPKNIDFFREVFLYPSSEVATGAMKELGEQIVEQLRQIDPISQVFAEIMSNVVWGGLFSLIAAAFLRRKA